MSVIANRIPKDAEGNVLICLHTQVSPRLYAGPLCNAVVGTPLAVTQEKFPVKS